MRYLKDLPRRFKNGFRDGTTPKPKERKNVAAKWLDDAYDDFNYEKSKLKSQNSYMQCYLIV